MSWKEKKENKENKQLDLIQMWSEAQTNQIEKKKINKKIF